MNLLLRGLMDYLLLLRQNRTTRTKFLLFDEGVPLWPLGMPVQYLPTSYRRSLQVLGRPTHL
jgi:hypothetical protein